MTIDVAIRVLPVEARSIVRLECDHFISDLPYGSAKRLAHELSCAANRAKKLSLTKSTTPTGASK